MSQALTTSSAGGPSWQVDIPGLSQLILSAGSYGLKQLALSGVDIHTIGCMLMIAENTPASTDYRKHLSRIRDQQRNEKYWMYKLVEIGAATNFLADQFLKTKAGENVVALLSATIPVMNEDACIVLLSTLFEASGVSLENTPGTNQLISIRKSLTPLARRTGFGDKVFHYHFFLKRFLSRTTQASLPHVTAGNIGIAVPTPENIPHIIRLLHKLTTSGKDYVLIHRGIRGAAWVVAYATFVLGLSACALDAGSQPVPITGDYGASKIILELESGESSSNLFLAGELHEAVRVHAPASLVQRGWSIDCTSTNVMNALHPGLRSRPEFIRISIFTAIECMNSIDTACFAFEQSTPDTMYYRARLLTLNDQLETYVRSVINKLRERGLKILHLLGFQPPTHGYRWSLSNDGRLQCVGHDSDPEPTYEIIEEGSGTYEVTGIFGRTTKPSKVRRKKTTGQYLMPGYDARDDESGHRSESTESMRLRVYLEDPMHPDSGFSKWSAYSRQAISDTVNFGSGFAAKVAFTDWDSSARLISVSALSNQRTQPFMSDGSLGSIIADAIQLCFDGVSTKVLEKRQWTDDWIALDLDGVVVFRHATRVHNIDEMLGCFLSFQIGSIEFEGSGYNKIRMDRAATNSDGRSFLLTSDSSSEDFPCIPLINGFPDCRLRPLLSVTSDTLFLRLEAHVRPQQILMVDSTLSAKHLPSLLVTKKCQHDPNEVTKYGDGDTNFIDILQEGLLFFDDRRMAVSCRPPGEAQTSSPVYVQQTKNNDLAQWLALQWKPDEDPSRCLRILQKRRCISCTYRLASEIVSSIYNSPAEVLPTGYPVCIIAGNEEKPARDERSF